MENNTLRIRIVSLKDSAKQSLTNVLCYIKKLTNLPSNNGKTYFNKCQRSRYRVQPKLLSKEKSQSC